MSRLRFLLVVLVVLSVLSVLSVAVAGCGSATISASPSASSGAPAGPTAGSPSGPPSESAAESTAEPSSEAAPPVETEPPASHLAPDLEALLPGKLGAATLSRESDKGSALLDAWTRAMVTFLSDAGKTADDLQFAQAWDAASGLDVSIMAFTVKGIAGSALRQAITEGLLAGSPDTPQSSETISGKAVTKVSSADDGWTTYLYDHGDVVFLVGTADATLAATALAALP